MDQKNRSKKEEKKVEVKKKKVGVPNLKITEFYNLEKLTKKPYPKGINISKREAYLTDEDFLKIFKMTKKEFSELKKWR